MATKGSPENEYSEKSPEQSKDKTGASGTAGSDSTPERQAPAKSGPATKEQIASNLEKLQMENPGLHVKTSIMDYMKARGLSGSLDDRKRIAAENGIKGYSGLKEENIELYKRLLNKYGNSTGDLPETIVL